jgi:hypothetical protein
MHIRSISHDVNALSDMAVLSTCTVVLFGCGDVLFQHVHE